jgi:hypothetical protein
MDNGKKPFLRSPFSLHLALSRIRLAALSVRSGEPVNQSDLQLAQALSEELGRRLEFLDDPVEKPPSEESAPESDSMGHHVPASPGLRLENKPAVQALVERLKAFSSVPEPSAEVATELLEASFQVEGEEVKG